MREVTCIGDIFYVPTHEILDELSEDEEYEQKVICFHQKNIVIFYTEPNIEPKYKNE